MPKEHGMHIADSGTFREELVMPRPDEHTPPLSPELAAKLEGKLLPLCRIRGCEKLEGHEDAHGPIVFNMTPIERPARKWSRSSLYGRSRVNDWPLWIAWLLAPSKGSRRIVRDLIALKKAGVDV